MNAPITVLLVDDSPEFLDVAAGFVDSLPDLKRLGCARSGAEALALAERLHPDLVLLDIAMPEQNGLETARRLLRLAPAPRVVLLTLYDTPEYRQAGAAVPVDGFLSKSALVTELPSLLARLFPAREEAAAAEEMPMQEILIVDDSRTMRKMVRASLQGLAAVRFHEAGNGLEAIETIALQPIALMVLDLNMPDLHGLEVIGFVRGHERYRDLPILVLTTRGDQGSRATALAAGATRYLTKPFDPAKLVAEVKTLLGRERGAA